MMHYTGQVYRPPMEHMTPLLEVSSGCSHNKCVFCRMYDESPFRMSDLKTVEADIVYLADIFKDRPVPRIYLTGGDPFVLPTDRLLAIADLLHQHMKGVKTITCYASFYNLKNKTVDDLKALKDAGYGELYIGVETGYAPALEMINKGVTLKESIDALEKLKAAGMTYHAILMLGIAGKGNGEANAKGSADLLAHYPPKSVLVMTTSVSPGTDLEKMRDAGDFVESTEREILEEQIALLEALDLPDETMFSGRHMVNLIMLEAPLAQKEAMIAKLKATIASTPDAILDKPTQRQAM